MALTETEAERLQSLLEDLEPVKGKMNNWEQSFLQDQLDRYQKYGASIFMSPKQWQTLQKMHDEYIGTDNPDDRDDD